MSDSKDIVLNMNIFKTSEWWKEIVKKIDDSIKIREDILLWKTNINVLDSDMNKQQYNKYDLLRLELNHLEELKLIPDEIIRFNDSIIQDIPNKE